MVSRKYKKPYSLIAKQKIQRTIILGNIFEELLKQSINKARKKCERLETKNGWS